MVFSSPGGVAQYLRATVFTQKRFFRATAFTQEGAHSPQATLGWGAGTEVARRRSARRCPIKVDAGVQIAACPFDSTGAPPLVCNLGPFAASAVKRDEALAGPQVPALGNPGAAAARATQAPQVIGIRVAGSELAALRSYCVICSFSRWHMGLGERAPQLAIGSSASAVDAGGVVALSAPPSSPNSSY